MKFFVYKYSAASIGILSLFACATAAEKPSQHHANIPGKISAPIEMQYTLDAKPELGKPLEIAIQFSTGKTADQIKASIKPTIGLNLQTMQHDFMLPLDVEGKTTLMLIPLIPQEAGLNYLHIIAQVKIRGRNQAKAFSIPVTIGSIAPSQKISNTRSNEPGIINLPAIERVR